MWGALSRSPANTDVGQTNRACRRLLFRKNDQVWDTTNIYIYIWARELFGAPWEAIHVQSSDPNVSNPSTIHLIQLYHLIQLVHLCTHISFANISTIYLNISNL